MNQPAQTNNCAIAETPADCPPPSLLRRLTAMIYDGLLVIAAVFIVNALALGLQVKINPDAEHVLPPNLGLSLILLTSSGFFTAFWLKGGQTLGMQAWRVKLISSEGGDPRLGQCLLRCLGALVSACCLGLGYLWCLVDKNKRYWHDYLSGTELILLPKRGKK